MQGEDGPGCWDLEAQLTSPVRMALASALHVLLVSWKMFRGTAGPFGTVDSVK